MDKKKILYIHQYFKTPEEAGGTRSYYFAKKLIENDYDVTMLTSNTDRKDWSFIKKMNVDGINIIYVKNYYNNKMNKFARIYSFLKFVLFSIAIGFKQKKINLVLATSTPLTVGIPALFFKIFKNKPFVFEVRDLWPDIPVEIGVIRNKIIKKILYFLEKKIYLKALHIIALSPGMKDGIILKGIHNSKISVISNMANNELFYPAKPTNILRNKLNLTQDKIVCIHAGAMGKVNGLVKFVKTFVENTAEIHFVFIGQGAEKNELINLSEKLDNLHILDSVPKHDLNDLIQDCDFTLMVVDPEYKIFETNSANKFFEYLSSAKPIIMNYKGWKYDLLKNNNCGFFIDPYNPDDLAEKTNDILKDKNKLEIMGQNSHKLAKEYDKDVLCDKFVSIIDNVLKKK